MYRSDGVRVLGARMWEHNFAFSNFRYVVFHCLSTKLNVILCGGADERVCAHDAEATELEFKSRARVEKNRIRGNFAFGSNRKSNEMCTDVTSF